ncbi:prephenate dehydratase [Telmatobacter bradus]|uniref:prephenate dehydratase n=1 Tax=Telmatobacter bradus TaxID=474953 RepID=UPI003B43BD3D
MKIAIQGEPGSFSHEAALKMDPEAALVPCTLSAGVFARLAAHEADVAVIPIENSLAGSVSEHFDLLLNHDVKVVREELLRIRHNLIGIAGTRTEEIERVYSHPVALAQCRRFLAEHPRMASYAFYDTAGSVKQVVETQDAHAAAIASKEAARCYGAQILEADIEDNPENYTRFFLVHRAAEAVVQSEVNKISLAFALANQPGSLVAALSAFAALGVNMTKIESRPVQGRPWEYIFYADCQVANSDEASRAVQAIQPHCSMVKELGRYREGVL